MKKLITCTAALFLSWAYPHNLWPITPKAADNYFTNGDYASAAEYYEKYLGGSKAGEEAAFNPYAPQTGNRKAENNTLSKEKAAYQLAECYRMLHFPAKAEAQYKILIGGEHQFRISAHPISLCLPVKGIGEICRCREAFFRLPLGYKANDSYKKNAERELKTCSLYRRKWPGKTSAIIPFIKLAVC